MVSISQRSGARLRLAALRPLARAAGASPLPTLRLGVGSWSLGVDKVSEQIFQRQLHLARGPGAADDAEVRVAERAVRVAPIHPVERVVGLGAELDPPSALHVER